jgi:hypothetical protein
VALRFVDEEEVRRMSQPIRRRFALAVALLGFCATVRAAGDTVILVEQPMPPPSWALLERELLHANARACEEFFDHYFDDRGYLECVTRWGGDDGPDDAIENLSDWPVLHALGAPESVLRLYKKGWEGHLRQYTEARTSDVEIARDGMYYKEFPVSFDWMHNGEGLTPFNLQGLADPGDARFRQRVTRFAGFYVNEDPGAPNYDKRHRLIRSMFNGSRGPLLRPATAKDWAGDPIRVEGRFHPGHGEHNYREMLDHFRDYTDIVGDHPQNLRATTLALNAYMLNHESKYKTWLLEYVDAWRQRMRDNGGIIPTKIGLDGKIGGPEARWYGGVYGWAFTVIDPVTGQKVHRNHHDFGLVGFGNAYLLTGDDRYLDVWRKQIDAVNAHKKVLDGKDQYPRMYGEGGWYDFTPRKYDYGALELYYWSMCQQDRDRLPGAGWLAFLEGQDPGYPERSLRAAFAAIHGKLEGMRRDTTTPDTRLADDPLAFNPATVDSLIELTLGGIYPGHCGGPLHCRVRHFDPLLKRAGLPQDVAALVEGLLASETTLTLVNVNQSEARQVIVQAGGYAEHQWQSATIDGREVRIDRSNVTVNLGPGAGARLVLKLKRYVNQPTLAMPWDQG